MKALIFSLITGILITLSGCGKEEIVTLSGNIVGFVSLIDESGNEVKDKSGVKVTLKDTPAVVNTDLNGRFEFKNLSAGTYNLEMNKEGYGTYKRSYFQFVGGNVPALLTEPQLYAIPSIEIQSLDISTDGLEVMINATISETKMCWTQVFFHDSSNVSNVIYSHYKFYPAQYFYEFTELDIHASLNYSPFAVGDTIYMVIYFTNPYEETGYYDYDLGRHMKTSVKKATSVIELILE